MSWDHLVSMWFGFEYLVLREIPSKEYHRAKPSLCFVFSQGLGMVTTMTLPVFNISVHVSFIILVILEGF